MKHLVLLSSFFLAAAFASAQGKGKGKASHQCEDMIVDVSAEDAGDLVKLTWEVTNPCKYGLSHAEFSVPDSEDAVTVFDSTVLGYDVEFTATGIKYETIDQGIAKGETEVFSYAVSKEALLADTTVAISLKAATSVFAADIDLTEALAAANITEIVKEPISIEPTPVKEPVEAPIVKEPVPVEEG